MLLSNYCKSSTFEIRSIDLTNISRSASPTDTLKHDLHELISHNLMWSVSRALLTGNWSTWLARLWWPECCQEANTVARVWQKLQDTQTTNICRCNNDFLTTGITHNLANTSSHKNALAAAREGSFRPYLWKRNELWIQSGRTAINRTQKLEPLLIIFTHSLAGSNLFFQ